eukprot:2411660-Prymnesium_polylepis.1
MELVGECGQFGRKHQEGTRKRKAVEKDGASGKMLQEHARSMSWHAGNCSKLGRDSGQMLQEHARSMSWHAGNCSKLGRDSSDVAFHLVYKDAAKQ